MATPYLYVGGLSGRVYIATKYKVLAADGQPGIPIEATEKFDISDRFEEVARELGWVKP